MDATNEKLEKLRRIVEDVFEGELRCRFITKNSMIIEVV